MKTDLKPTLWRTMRVLAHPRRLQLLRELLLEAPQSVSECARRGRIPRVSTTMALRQLQARGLIRAERVSRWVMYRPLADPLVAHAAAILDAMRAALKPAQPDWPQIVRAVTSFTHERRIRVVQALAQQQLTVEQLAATCHISLPALSRHLAKLERRKVICCEKHHWQLQPPADPLAAALLAAMLKDGEQN
ncbi:MAG: ArsR family transcriptional regulator [Kiritimatiellia bacterium]